MKKKQVYRYYPNVYKFLLAIVSYYGIHKRLNKKTLVLNWIRTKDNPYPIPRPIKRFLTDDEQEMFITIPPAYQLMDTNDILQLIRHLHIDRFGNTELERQRYLRVKNLVDEKAKFYLKNDKSEFTTLFVIRSTDI